MTQKTIAIYSDTRGRARCRGCQASITWAEIVGSGKKMPFDGDPVALSTHHDPANRRLIEVLDLAENHWGSCSEATSFKQKAKA